MLLLRPACVSSGYLIKAGKSHRKRNFLAEIRRIAQEKLLRARQTMHSVENLHHKEKPLAVANACYSAYIAR
jgi:hypothetical protein